MKAALICPGPSLSQTWHDADRYARLYAVNRAPLLIGDHVDVWCFNDWQIFEQYQLEYKPRVMTTGTCLDHLMRHGKCMAGYRVSVIDGLKSPEPATWRLYTKTSAMVFAASEDCRELHIYGDDMQGDIDADGYRDDRNNRTDERWHSEAAITHIVETWMRSQGIKVVRHGIA